MSLQAIADRLNADNIKNARGNEWSKQAIKLILSNKFYTGIVKFNDIEQSGKHEPIINKVTFGKVQSELQKNRRNQS